jgi:hypothetical protein
MSAPDPLEPNDALQKQPTPPTLSLHLPENLSGTPDVALPIHGAVWTKLHILLHAHQLAASASRKLLFMRIALVALAVLVALPLGIFSGSGMYALFYEDPSRHVQSYHDWGKEGKVDRYYVKGRETSQQDHDYYLKSSGNSAVVSAFAVPFGFLVGCTTVFIFWLVLRPRNPSVYVTVEEQIAAIVKDHPEAVAAWGGVAVLRIPELIEQLLGMQAKDAKP